MKRGYLKQRTLFLFLIIVFEFDCNYEISEFDDGGSTILPLIISQPVKDDPDDPAIWVDSNDPEQSLILGTDKGGTLFVYNLNGRIVKSVTGGKRFNNVDVEYGLTLNGTTIDIAVVTDRDAGKIRVFSLPEMIQIDGGGIQAFGGKSQRRPMGVALYKRPRDGALFAVVSRKEGPPGRYLWQYRLQDDGTGKVQFTKVREFGEWSGRGEIEAVAVDDALGYVYYADELFGIRKYLADPEAPDANRELATFGADGFAGDREGISIYTINDGTGYILISDQQANKFRIYKREGAPNNPHDHELVKIVTLSTKSSDGSDVTNAILNATFATGLFVAMSNDKTFQFYSWQDIAGTDLKVAPNGIH
jgi:3-phytase